MPGRMYRLSGGFIVLLLCACGGGGGQAAPVPPPATGTTLNLYPETSTADGARLFIKVTAVGTTAVEMPLAFDTGSAGITLYAFDIFPANMLGASGFVFAPGETSISYNGITVTNQSGTRKFGSATTGRTQTGNIGYTQVTFGDSAGAQKTSLMPVFLYYLITDNSNGQAVPVPHQRGWFGVAGSPNLITIPGSTKPAAGYPACATGTTGSCYVVSVLKYLTYPDGVHAGFMLSPSPLQSCDITLPGDCLASPMLTVGLDDSATSGFSTVQLACPPINYVGPGNIDGYPVCQMGIPGTTVAVTGLDSGMLNTTVLFDSGTPTMVLNIPSGSAFPASVSAGDSVNVQTPSGFSFDYTAGAASEVTATVVQPNSTAGSIIGIGYFTAHAFLLDLTSGVEGWK